MSETIVVRPIKAFVLDKAGGAKAHYREGGDYNVRPEIAEAMLLAGALEEGAPVAAPQSQPEFMRPTALEPEDTGDIIADEE